MSNLLVIPIQSLSDVITNSSSEIFVLDTNKPIEKVVEILETITTGFQEPIIFDLKEFKKVDFEEEENNDYFNLNYNGYYNTIRNNFVDLDDEVSVYRDKLTSIFFNDNYKCLENKINRRLNELFPSKEFHHWYTWDICYHFEYLKPAIAVIKEYEAKHKPVKAYNPPLQELDGKIIVLSESDNTIPFETFDIIDNVLNGKHYHLG